MDAAYYPSSKMVRQHGVLELVAASVSEDHIRAIERCAFTRALSEILHTRASQRFMQPLSAAGLHAKLLSQYPQMIQDQSPEKEMLTSFPSPLHMQMSGNARLPSILLAPLKRSLSYVTDPDQSGPQLNLSIRVTDEALNMESWAEWLRMMPDGVKDLKVEGPYRNNFR